MDAGVSSIGGLESVQARIASIQARIAALDVPQPALHTGAGAAASSASSRPVTPAATRAGSFDAALQTALSGGPGSTTNGASGPAAVSSASGSTSAIPAAAPSAVPSAAPVGRPAATGTDPAPARAPEWAAPVTGRISSPYGPRRGEHHTGLDVAVPTGTPVRSASGGVVRSAGWKGGYGNAVVVDHPNGISTLYAHNSRLLVEPGDRVAPGEVIAKSGSTGRSTGPHLHFEVRVEDRAVDPLDYLRDRGVRI